MKTKKSFLSRIMIILFLSISCLNAQTAIPPKGNGSKIDPYQIATLENLYWLTQNSSEWDRQFIQTADINAKDTKNWDKGKGFSPIGTESNPFTGYYDGDNHIIKGITINRTSTDHIGVFGYVSGGALTIENLGVTDADVSGRNFIGILVGANYYSGTTVSNCYTTGNVTGHDEIGGLIGRNRYGSKTEYCHSSADVSSAYARVGGLVWC